MILTDYYKYVRLPECKSKTRIDRTASTKSYPEFERKPFAYITENSHIKAGIKRKTDLTLTSGDGKHITSIYRPDLESGITYGDVQGTTDLIVIVSKNFQIDADGKISTNAEFEIFVARGQKHNKNACYNLFADGELNNEIAELRGRAVTELVTDQTGKKLPNQ
jgi:hypothetical protein